MRELTNAHPGGVGNITELSFLLVLAAATTGWFQLHMVLVAYDERRVARRQTLATPRATIE